MPGTVIFGNSTQLGLAPPAECKPSKVEMISQSAYVSPSLRLIDDAKVIKQGAEAKVYLLPTYIPEPEIYWPPSSSSTNPHELDSHQPAPLILKHRFPKQYRHPTLNASLTKTRLSFEARSLARCARADVVVPGVRWVDEVNGVLGMEFVEGWSVREILGGGAEGEVEIQDDEEEAGDGEPLEEEEEATIVESEGMEALEKIGVTRENLMTSIGSALAKLHLTTIIHGDLTTSNMMVRLTPNNVEPYEIVLIDFGLSSTATLAENYAVDLYVLERAFASTHPASESLYAGVLDAYAIGLGEKKWKPIEAKLKEVRLRGRKRDMTG